MKHSYSSISVYETCPQKYKYKYIDKLKEPTTWALKNGIMRHEELEKFLKGETAVVPSGGYSFVRELFALKEEYGAYAEQQLAFDHDWAQVPWMHPAARFRIKIDAFYIYMDSCVVGIDFKTGRQYSSHVSQLECTALSLMKMLPHYQSYKMQNWYLEGGDVRTMEFKPEAEPSLQLIWETKMSIIENDSDFHATPSDGACGYCHFRRSNGGPCDHF